MKVVTDISGLRDIRSMHSTGQRSIPRVQSSAYLDLYMLRKEKERLEKEESLLEKRKHGIQKRLKELQRQMEALEKSAQADGSKSTSDKAEKKDPSERKWKTMALNY